MNLPAGDHLKADYVAINRKSTIPALVRRDGTVLTEVQAIAYWLAHAYPRARLWPQDAEISTWLIEAMSYIVGTVHGQGFARIFTTNMFSRNPADHEAQRELGREIVAKGFAVLDAAIDPGEYLAGSFSAADPILFYVAFWADKLRLPLPKNLAAHYRRMLARPAVERVLREEGYDPRMLGKMPETDTARDTHVCFAQQVHTIAPAPRPRAPMAADKATGLANRIECEERIVAEMIIVEERNQDDMSRKAGCYLYADTKLWLEGNCVHRSDGPAVIFPDGAERWYVHGKEVTREVKTFFLQNKWPVQRGLDTPEKLALFQARFLR